MKSKSVLSLLGAGLLATQLSAATLTSGYYLKWNTDHTERGLRPAYAIADEQWQHYALYRIETALGRPRSVCHFRAGAPSNHGDFGAHCITFSYSTRTAERRYVDVNGVQVANVKGVHVERYLYDTEGFYHTRLHLDAAGNLVEDSEGVAQYRFQRDHLGRRESERRLNVNGEVVPEHNGFFEARFAFDANDYARYRMGYDRDGKPAPGPKGYAAAYFWFDQNGNFLKEEFRNLAGQLVPGPSGQFARIEYHDIDDFGNWHKATLYDAHGALLNGQAAILRAQYNGFLQRESLTYRDARGMPAENSRGVHRYHYRYGADGVLITREAHALSGRRVE